MSEFIQFGVLYHVRASHVNRFVVKNLLYVTIMQVLYIKRGGTNLSLTDRTAICQVEMHNISTHSGHSLGAPNFKFSSP